MINTLRILGASGVLKRFFLVAALLGSGLLVAACGQKGPLFIAGPQDGAPQQPAGGPPDKAPPTK